MFNARVLCSHFFSFFVLMFCLCILCPSSVFAFCVPALCLHSVLVLCVHILCASGVSCQYGSWGPSLSATGAEEFRFSGRASTREVHHRQEVTEARRSQCVYWKVSSKHRSSQSCHFDQSSTSSLPKHTHTYTQEPQVSIPKKKKEWGVLPQEEVNVFLTAIRSTWVPMNFARCPGKNYLTLVFPVRYTNSATGVNETSSEVLSVLSIGGQSWRVFFVFRSDHWEWHL